MEVLMILKAHVKQLLTISFAVTLLSCNNSTNSNPANVNKDTIIEKPVSEKRNVEVVTKISVNNMDSLPEQIKHEGDIVDTKMWKDKSGEHYVLISEKKQGEYLTANWLSKVDAYMYTKIDGNFKLGWHVKDNVSISSEINYLKKSLTVLDINNDGDAEVCFFYSFTEDGADPMPLKMILYTKEKKLAIRGLIPRSVSDLNLYKKVIDAKGVSKDIKTYASKEWDKTSTNQMKKIIGEEVIKSKDFPIKNN